MQYEIKTTENFYRADFLLMPVQWDVYNTSIPILIVECDGHNFHEKTKEQAKKDKERDRDLQMHGYRIIRFTGSEINNSSYACAMSVMKILSAFNNTD